MATAYQPAKEYAKMIKSCDDITDELKELGLPQNIPDECTSKIRALLITNKEFGQKLISLQDKISHYELVMIARTEKLGPLDEKKLAEIQGKYIDQIKMLEVKLRKRTDELSKFELQVKLLQDANRVIQNEFEDREMTMIGRQAELEAVITEYKERIITLEELLAQEQADRVREAQLMEIMKEQELEFKMRIEDIIEINKKKTEEMIEDFEREMRLLKEISQEDMANLRNEYEKTIEDMKHVHKEEVKNLIEEYEEKMRQLKEESATEINKLNEENSQKMVEKEAEFNLRIKELEDDLSTTQRSAIEAKINCASLANDNEMVLLEVKRLQSAVNVLPSDMKIIIKKAASGTY